MTKQSVKNTRFSTTVLKYILYIVCAYDNVIPGFTACGDGGIDGKHKGRVKKKDGVIKSQKRVRNNTKYDKSRQNGY